MQHAATLVGRITAVRNVKLFATDTGCARPVNARVSSFNAPLHAGFWCFDGTQDGKPRDFNRKQSTGKGDRFFQNIMPSFVVRRQQEQQQQPGGVVPGGSTEGVEQSKG